MVVDWTRALSLKERNRETLTPAYPVDGSFKHRVRSGQRNALAAVS